MAKEDRKKGFADVAVLISMVLALLILIGFVGGGILGYSIFSPFEEIFKIISGNAISSIYGPTDGLVGYWNFNDAGNLGKDSGSNSLNAVSINGASSVDGKIEKAVSMNGGYIFISDLTNSILNLTDKSFTLSLWTKMDSSLSNKNLLSLSDKPNSVVVAGITLGDGPNRGKFTALFTNEALTRHTAACNNAPVAGEWYHVAEVYDGSKIYIYVNGNSCSSADVTGRIKHPSAAYYSTKNGWYLGDASSSYSFTGLIDEASIYSRALSSSEISEIYNAGAPSSGNSNNTANTGASSSSSTGATGSSNSAASGSDSGTPEIDEPPRISQGSPVGILITNINSFKISMVTNENATCRYSEIKNETYELMKSMTTINSLQHEALISQLQDRAFYNYYIKCKDNSGNINSDSYLISFSVRLESSSFTPENNANASNINAGNESIESENNTLANGTLTMLNETSEMENMTINISCVLTNAYWNKEEVKDAEDVEMVLESANCIGKEAKFLIYETDGVLGKQEREARSVLIESNITKARINAKWIEDYLLGLKVGGGPEYVFKVSVNPEIESNNTLIVLQSRGLSEAGSAWIPPIGIPNPSDYFSTFGAIDRATPDWPASWRTIPTTATANYYFIDKSNTGCTNTANTYGHPDKPKCNPPEGLLAAGAYVYFNGGTYVQLDSAGDRFDWHGNGMPDAPIWVTGNPVNKPTIQDFVHIGAGGNASYIVFENFNLNGGRGSVQMRPLSNVSINHILVRNVNITGTGALGDSGGFLVGLAQTNDPAANSSVDYVVLFNSTISNIGYIGPLGPSGDEAGAYMGFHASWFWVLDSEIHHIGADSVAGSQYSNSENASVNKRSAHYFIGRNTMYQNGENSIDLKAIEHGVISENIMYGPFQDESAQAVILHYGVGGGVSTGLKNFSLLSNKMFNSSAGIAITNAGTDAGIINIIGNKFYNIHANDATRGTQDGGTCIGFRAFKGTMNIIDNTCYDYDWGITIQQALTSTDFVNIHGNIFSKRNLTGGGRDVSVVGSPEAYVDMDYNLFYTEGSPANFTWGGAKSLSQIKSVIGECAHCYESDPKLNNANNSDFSLQSDSPAKDASLEHSIYDSFANTYGLNIKKDILGVTRPQGIAWDIGAYESTGIVTDTTPPVRSSGSPSGALAAGTTSVSLELTTNENATCRYSASSGTAYNSMNAFATTGSTSHLTSASGLSNGTGYNYYVKCNDTSGNVNTDDYAISFSIVSPLIVCGNTIIETGETCDSNSQACTINSYLGTQQCNAQCSQFNSCVATQRCGDGIVNGMNGIEQCDDGNSIDNDICSNQCRYPGSCTDLDHDGFIDYNPLTCTEGRDKELQTNITNWSMFIPKYQSEFFNITFNENEDYRNMSNFTLKKQGFAQIRFRERMRIVDVNETGGLISLNLSALIEFRERKIIVRSENFSEFSKPAQIEFSNISYISPKILRDGVECTTGLCNITSYNSGTGLLNVEIPGFSEYEIVEGYTETSPSGSSGSSGGGGGGGGGGGASTLSLAANNTINEISNYQEKQETPSTEAENKTSLKEKIVKMTPEIKAIADKKTRTIIYSLIALVLFVLVFLIIWKISKITKKKGKR